MQAICVPTLIFLRPVTKVIVADMTIDAEILASQPHATKSSVPNLSEVQMLRHIRLSILCLIVTLANRALQLLLLL